MQKPRAIAYAATEVSLICLDWDNLISGTKASLSVVEVFVRKYGQRSRS